MGKFQLHNKDCPVYPGSFAASPEEEKMLQDLFEAGKTTEQIPLVNLDEFTDCYRIEAALPGIRREDIYVQVKDNIISIAVLHKDREEMKKKLQIHEFDCKCLERHIPLPENADTEFVSAEFRQGILSLHIPKSQKQTIVQTHQIVVY
jgi:HSP20 family protein